MRSLTMPFGQFEYWYDPEKFWSLKNLRTLEFPEVDYDDSKEDQNVDVTKRFNYGFSIDVIADLYPPSGKP